MKLKNKETASNDAPVQSNNAEKEEPQTAGDSQSQRGSKARFIVFIGIKLDSVWVTYKKFLICIIGNLPFTATKDAIEKHFKSVEPHSIRLITHKDSGKSKGYAFLEFNRYDHMKTCLKLFHHSSFDDGKSPPRKINVDLT
jgi:nucleolar protein 6